jgi:hypothetical protein
MPPRLCRYRGVDAVNVRLFFPFLCSSSLTLLTSRLRAYRDSDHLERYKVGFLGDLADQFVRAE